MVDEVNQEQEMSEIKSFSAGDLVKGTVTKIEDKQVLVDVGYKVDGIVPIKSLSSLHVESPADVVETGEELELKVIKIDDDELILSKQAVDEEKAWEDLEQKFENNVTFEAEVKEVVKGGLVVDLGVRGFIPASLVERHYVENFDDYKGRTLTLKVLELDRDKNRVILSHRAVVDEEIQQKKGDTLASLEAGQVLPGTVQRLTDFGAFVDIGGIDGLVHISQLAHHHVEKPSDVVEEGQEVQVKVLSVDHDNERISLSIKETLPGPWEEVANKVQAGDELDGTVKRLVSFGAFVEILPGVEGLVHISQISNRHIGTPHEVLEEGQEVRVKVLEVNPDEHRVSLSIRDLLEESAQEEHHAVTPSYEEEDGSGVKLGDLFGDALKKFK
ncbi:30S ribosomal protein S1 [Bacillaceae bacterium SIJ1]|uniref:30S ribosomal protein S1 n=1 Tax=Litoribacterium kuwaitense TaxID=1398745 RepID=UPI0013EA1F61|nr:30S ribosomal protein S1 [Litoribacterium kuwaitense]NGP43693.1 30S ribosomal protein S1 [Litoribacterium kuwaitense]